MTADTRTPGQVSETEARIQPSAKEILDLHGISAAFKLRNYPNTFIVGPMVDDAAQAAADASGLSVTYDANYNRSRTVNPGDNYLSANFHPDLSLKEVRQSIGGRLQFVMDFPSGTDPELARRAVEEIVAREEVQIVLRVDQLIDINKARKYPLRWGPRPASGPKA